MCNVSKVYGQVGYESIIGFRPGSFEFVVGIDKLMKRLINGCRVKSVVTLLSFWRN